MRLELLAAGLCTSDLAVFRKDSHFRPAWVLLTALVGQDALFAPGEHGGLWEYVWTKKDPPKDLYIGMDPTGATGVNHTGNIKNNAYLTDRGF